MKQLGSMAGVSSHRSLASGAICSLATGAKRSGEGATRVLALVAGLPIVIGFFLSSSDAALAQVALQAAASDKADVFLDPLEDRDGDGLDNALEEGQYSAAGSVDTDHDGWNDAEELARGSLATAFVSQPADLPVSIGAGAYMRNGKLHVALATYIRSGSMENARLDVGILALKRMIPLAPASYMQHLTVTTVPTHDAGELLMVTDIIVPSAPLFRTGRMSIYATLRVGDKRDFKANFIRVNWRRRGSCVAKTMLPRPGRARVGAGQSRHHVQRFQAARRADPAQTEPATRAATQ